MSGNKIGFNEITEIGFNGNYGADLNSRLKAINDNFQKIANADYMKGVDGDDVRVLNASFANGDNGSPLDGGNLYSNNGEEITKITKGSLYTSILNCIAGLIGNAGGDGAINGINWYDGLLENNSIMIIADEENGNYYLKSSLYFVYNDPRFANPTENSDYGSLKNLSCVVTYDGKEWVASQPFPKIYYSVDVNDFCWEINGQQTKLIARGPQGLSGQNYPVWLCYSNPTDITDITATNNDTTISITIDGIYRYDGTGYNYITPDDDKWTEIISKEEFKNNMALCIVHAKDTETNKPIIRLYCGYLYLKDNKLSIYTTQNSAIDTIIGHETLYSLLKSNSQGNTIQNSLFIPTESVDAGGSLSGKQIYSIYGLNETVSNQTYHTFNIGVSTVNNDQTLTQQIGRTKLNLWSGEMNFKSGWNGGINFNVGDNALQIKSGQIDKKRNLISDHTNDGKPRRYIQMKLPESYLTFESYTQRNLSDSLSPIDAAMNPEACANRLSFYNPDLVDVEFSTNGGTTWEDCFKDPITGKINQDSAYKIKTKLLTTGFKDMVSNLSLGRTLGATAGENGIRNTDKLRVSIYIRPGEFYGKLDKLNLYTSLSGTALQMNCNIYLYKIAGTKTIASNSVNNDIKKYYDTNPSNTLLKWELANNKVYTHEKLSGEPGWNSISLDESNLVGSYNNTSDTYTFANGRVYKIVLEFGLVGDDAATTNVARVYGIRLFGSKWYVIKDKNGNTNSLAGYNSICSWDENGAAVFPAGISNQQFKITYNKLKDLADNGKLIPGTKYRITDYKPKFNGIDIKSGEHQFDIIVEATDNKNLSEKANAVLHDGDTYFENSKLNKWELKYSLNTSGFDWTTEDDPGVIYYMKDEFDNVASYDFKNVMYVLNISNDDPSPRNHIIYSLLDKYKKNIITKYLTDHSDQFDQNLSTWIQKGSQITLTYDCPCLFYTFSSIYIDNLNIISADESNISCSFDVKTKDYSFTEFCYNNVLGKNSLYNIFIAAIEQSGTSYVTKNNKLDINCTNNIFGENCRNNIFGEKCIGNNFVGYCEDNCFENFCSRNNCDEYFKGNKLGDHISDNVFGKNYVHNIIKSYLIKSTFGNNCNNNTFGTEVSVTNTSNNNTNYNYESITFGDNCSNNNLGQRCYNINFGDNCSNNNLGQRCYDINFGDNCSNNNLGQRCYDINFGKTCSYNNLGQICYDIIFSNYCVNNNLGSNNSTIKTSSNSQITNCTIGNGCNEILFISPLTCAIGTKMVPIIYDPMPISVTGAKIENNCEGFIISVFKKIKVNDSTYASFLLYNTDSDNYYKGYEGKEDILNHRIFKFPVSANDSPILINSLNISNGTSRFRISDSVPSEVSEDIMPIKPTKKSFQNMNIDDLDNIFVNDYMIAADFPLPSNNFALSCKPLIFNKSKGIFSMKCTGSNTNSADSYYKVESIVAEFS